MLTSRPPLWLALVLLAPHPLALAQSSPPPQIPPAPPPLDALAPDLAPRPLTDADSVRDLSPALADIIKDSKTPGIVAAVIHNNRIIARGCAGLRAAGSDALVTTDDRFHIGSCTKAFTATLCAILVEEKLLTWNLTLSGAFPEHAASMNPAFKGVTLLELLQHRSGIPADVTKSGLWAKCFAHPGPPDKARAELLPEVFKLEPVGTPRETFLYSNFNYALAGHICERVAKTPYESLLHQRLLAPLGITSAGFGAPGSNASIDQPRGHRGPLPMLPGKMADNPPAIAPAGTLHLSVSDWARFAALHVAGARADQTLVLSPQSFKTLHTPPAAKPGSPGADYAGGWIATQRPWADGTALTHSGSNTMWFATLWLAPKKNFAVLVAANSADQATQKAVDNACAKLIESISPPPQSR